MFKIVEFSHYLIKEFINRNQNNNLLCIDATCGMGNDSLFIVKNINQSSTLICYDIQEVAINSTKELLKNYNNVVYNLQSHESFNEESADLIIYNLGYLPNTDKVVKTNSSTTLKSLENALRITNNKNDYLIIIVLYPGHQEGLLESQVIDNYCYNLSSSKYLVSKYLNYNRPTSPYIISITPNKKTS